MTTPLTKHLQSQPVHKDDDGSRGPTTSAVGAVGRLDPPAAGDATGPGVGDERGTQRGVDHVVINVAADVAEGKSGADRSDRQDVAELRIRHGDPGLRRTIRGGGIGTARHGPGHEAA